MEIDVIDVKVGAEVEVEQLIEAVKTGVARASRGKMFDLLRETRSRPERPKLGWVHQLAHMSREFIQALLMRAALCGRRRPADYVFYPPFADHGRAEYRHPIELEEWVPRIREAAAQAKETHVLMNNCYANYGSTNARELAALLLEPEGEA